MRVARLRWTNLALLGLILLGAVASTHGEGDASSGDGDNKAGEGGDHIRETTSKDDPNAMDPKTAMYFYVKERKPKDKVSWILTVGNFVVVGFL